MSEQKHPLTVFIEERRGAIAEALSGSPVDIGEFMVGLKSAVAKDRESGNGMLTECIAKNPNSVLQRLVEAAQVGLSPAPVLEHFHLVPRKMQGGIVCTSIIGYRGLCDLAQRSGGVLRIGAELVFPGETFWIDAMDGHITHDRDHFADQEEKDLRGAYAFAQLANGGQTVSRVMSKADLDKRRAKAQTDKIWGPWWREMYRKTVLRNLLKSGLVPLGEPARLAITRESEEERFLDVEATEVEATPEAVDDDNE